MVVAAKGPCGVGPCWVRAETLYLRGKLDLDRFVSETITLDQVEDAFDKMQRGEVLRSVVVL